MHTEFCRYCGFNLGHDIECRECGYSDEKEKEFRREPVL